MPRGEVVLLFGRYRKDFDPSERVIVNGRAGKFEGYPYDGDAWREGHVTFDDGEEWATVPLKDIQPEAPPSAASN